MSEDWDDAGSPGQQSELAREWDLRREQHYNSGYREGLDQGKEKNLQQGFDSGFTRGCAAGYEWGLLQGAASTLKVFAGQVQGTGVPEASALAASVDLPMRQVMLTQCEALMEQTQSYSTDSAKPHSNDLKEESSQITSQVFSKPFTASELQERIASARRSLHQMGFAPPFYSQSSCCSRANGMSQNENDK